MVVELERFKVDVVGLVELAGQTLYYRLPGLPDRLWVLYIGCLPHTNQPLSRHPLYKHQNTQLNRCDTRDDSSASLQSQGEPKNT